MIKKNSTTNNSTAASMQPTFQQKVQRFFFNLKKKYPVLKALKPQHWIMIAVLSLSAVGLASAMIVSNISQDIRQQASSITYNVKDACNVSTGYPKQVCNNQDQLLECQNGSYVKIGTCDDATSSQDDKDTQTAAKDDAGETGQPLENNERCEENNDCKSGNCVTTPYGKFCRESTSDTAGGCGDNVCQANESIATCPQDCSTPEANGTDNSVSIGETCTSTAECQEGLACSAGICKELINFDAAEDPNSDEPIYTACLEKYIDNVRSYTDPDESKIIGENSYQTSRQNCLREAPQKIWSDAVCSCIDTNTTEGQSAARIISDHQVELGYTPENGYGGFDASSVYLASNAIGYCATPTGNTCTISRTPKTGCNYYFDLENQEAARNACETARVDTKVVACLYTTGTDQVSCQLDRITRTDCSGRNGQEVNESEAALALQSCIADNATGQETVGQCVYINTNGDCDRIDSSLGECNQRGSELIIGRTPTQAEMSSICRSISQEENFVWCISKDYDYCSQNYIRAVDCNGENMVSAGSAPFSGSALYATCQTFETESLYIYGTCVSRDVYGNTCPVDYNISKRDCLGDKHGVFFEADYVTDEQRSAVCAIENNNDVGYCARIEEDTSYSTSCSTTNGVSLSNRADCIGGYFVAANEGTLSDAISACILSGETTTISCSTPDFDEEGNFRGCNTGSISNSSCEAEGGFSILNSTNPSYDCAQSYQALNNSAIEIQVGYCATPNSSITSIENPCDHLNVVTYAECPGYWPLERFNAGLPTDDVASRNLVTSLCEQAERRNTTRATVSIVSEEDITPEESPEPQGLFCDDIFLRPWTCPEAIVGDNVNILSPFRWMADSVTNFIDSLQDFNLRWFEQEQANRTAEELQEGFCVTNPGESYCSIQETKRYVCEESGKLFHLARWAADEACPQATEVEEAPVVVTTEVTVESTPQAPAVENGEYNIPLHDNSDACYTNPDSGEYGECCIDFGGEEGVECVSISYGSQFHQGSDEQQDNAWCFDPLENSFRVCTATNPGLCRTKANSTECLN
jgi:hypothetical protein